MPIDELFPESVPTARSHKLTDKEKSRQKAVTIEKPEPSSWGLPQWALSGGLATCGVFFAAWIGLHWLNTGKGSEQIYTTQIGEIRTLSLADGSEVKLNSAASCV